MNSGNGNKQIAKTDAAFNNQILIFNYFLEYRKSSSLFCDLSVLSEYYQNVVQCSTNTCNILLTINIESSIFTSYPVLSRLINDRQLIEKSMLIPIEMK
uniref:Uncharacterized protein n=1 Tax=Onchocerca volvulus TaxID=6282 RepID=A0A8R1TQ27_ONCVO